MPNRLVYPSVGVLETVGEFPEPQAIRSAYTPLTGVINIVLADGNEESLDLDSSNIEPYTRGLIHFTTNDGVKYRIRPVNEADGVWASEYKVQLPVNVLTKMLADLGTQESREMPYLEDERETMVTFQYPEDDYLMGVLYINRFGAYIRMNGTWVQVSPHDDTFDETFPYRVNKETAEKFIELFDQGPLAVEDASEYITSPDDEKIEVEEEASTEAED